MAAPPVEMHACRACGVELPETDLTLWDVTFHDDIEQDGQEWFYCAACLPTARDGIRCETCGEPHDPSGACPDPDDPDYTGPRIRCDVCSYVHLPGPCRWGRYSAGPGDPHGVLHYCEDGHHWTEQPDGGVSPSWGFGLSSIHYDQPPDRCPEPARGWSIYDDEHDPTARGDESVDGLHHGYKCPSCGAVHYVGGCGMGVRSDPWDAHDPPCEPPPPACGKPPVRTLHWRRGDTRHGISAGWHDPNAPLVAADGEQLGLGAVYEDDHQEQPAAPVEHDDEPRDEERDGLRLAVDGDDARDVECPKCGAAVGTYCKRPSGHKAWDAHAERWTALGVRFAAPVDTSQPGDQLALI